MYSYPSCDSSYSKVFDSDDGVGYDLWEWNIPGKIAESSIPEHHGPTTPPIVFPDPQEIENAIKVLSKAKRPLVIVGKGAAYARAEKEVRELIDATNLPFLATPMGKGTVPDISPNCVGPARYVDKFIL